ncbi:MAG: DUF4268 domain-containing protein [Deltaproteobacteria bacterium]|nr:DUF4268 domain-containing protein [Deltaproteobacteria bacterium]
MSVSRIGKLERVPLREVWKHEAHNFTQWLQENIDELSAVLDLNIVNVDREQSAGSFSIDLVAEDAGGGTIIIENQLEKSNHDHLGKLITYLTGMGAKAAVWIVSEPRPEHVAAIAWLNESNSAAFYMVKVEAVRIGDSPAAALFTLIVGPSEEAKDVGHTKKEISERYGIRKRWWTQLVERSTKVSKLHAHITPGEYSWIGTSSGVRGLNLNYAVTQEGCGAELYIDRGKDAETENASIFDQLYEHKDEVEKTFGGPLKWERLEGKRACRIKYLQKDGGYRSPEEKWPQIQDGIIQAMNRLEQALRPQLKKLKLG